VAVVTHLTDEPCDCPDALAFRAFLASPAGEAADALAATLAVWKLRSMSHDLAAASDWSRPRVSAAIVERERGQYDTPARTAQEIREATAASWAAFDRGEGPLTRRGPKVDAGR
jgi:hypothetical protein